MNDPFAKAKQIRNGELDEEMPSYEELTGWLQRAPLTWLPGLLIHIVQMCTIRPVFKEGGLERVVSQAAKAALPGSELRGEGRVATSSAVGPLRSTETGVDAVNPVKVEDLVEKMAGQSNE